MSKIKFIPAFPSADTVEMDRYKGMSIRLYVATQIMQALVTRKGIGYGIRQMAVEAFQFADALIEQEFAEHDFEE